ncbi:MAG: putative porin [Candidatus Acidiferrum sp.]
MRPGKLAVIVLSLAFCLPARAGDETPKAKSDDETTKNSAPAESRAAAKPSVDMQIEELRNELQAQLATSRAHEQRIQALESELRAAHSDAAPAGAVPAKAVPGGRPVEAVSVAKTEIASGEPQLDQKVEDIAADVAAMKKSFGERLKNIGPFSFSGDIRLRDEPFIGGPADQSQVRNRERFRIRLNGTAKYDDFSGGFTFNTGDVNNPVSTNQTTNQFYTRKPFELDKAYLEYCPHYFHPLTLTGGKFAYPWVSTELTWDKDLNPEGLAQTLSFNLERVPVLKRVALVGFELPFAETAGVSLNNKSIVQSAVYGGQLQTEWKLAEWLKFSAYAAFYNWHHADPVALAVAVANAASPDLGLLRLNNNADQNATVTTTGTFVATGQKVITNSQFASKFGLFDTIARLDIKTPAEKWPLVVLGDFVQNTEACANVDNILAAPANTALETFAQSKNAVCNSHQRRGYWLEGRVGRTQEKGDWNFSYTRIFVEREAVLGVFNYSEMRQGSNVSQHRVEAFYQAYKNIQLGFTGLFGRPLVTATSPGPAENLLKRLQFDVMYKF